MREIREGRKTADTREIHLRNTTDGLLNQLKALQNQRTAVHKPSSLVDERDMLGTWLVKYTNISQQLTNSEERVSEREKEIREGEEKVRKLTVQLKDAQVKRNVAVQALNEAEDRGSTQEGELGELQQTVYNVFCFQDLY
jgi:chromosome segregation ATPase